MRGGERRGVLDAEISVTCFKPCGGFQRSKRIRHARPFRSRDIFLFARTSFTKEPVILYSLYFLKIIFINNTTAFFSHSQARICAYDFHDEKVKVVFPFSNYLVTCICPRFLNDRSLGTIPSAKGVQVNLFKCRSIQKGSSTQAS